MTKAAFTPDPGPNGTVRQVALFCSNTPQHAAARPKSQRDRASRARGHICMSAIKPVNPKSISAYNQTAQLTFEGIDEICGRSAGEIDPIHGDVQSIVPAPKSAFSGKEFTLFGVPTQK